MPIRARNATPVQAHEDYGFFGPDSVTWRVWRYPTSLTVGFQRAVVIEELDPALIAAVDASGGVRSRPRTRYDRTLCYFARVAFGDTRTTSKAADVLVKVHSKAIGIEPLSGNRYDANDPHSQLWIHLTAWHSILYAYERYGPGKLSPEDEARYWADCVTAAELQTCDPDDVPRTREEIQEYFETMRPRLSGSEAAQSMMDFLLDGKVMFPPMPRLLTPLMWTINKTMRIATIATMPRWMRKMAGVRQSRVTDVLIRPVMRISFILAHANRHVELAILGLMSPSTRTVMEPIFLDVPPERAETLTPAQAQARYGYDKPSEAHLEWRERQQQRILGGEAPSDAGLVESESLLGAMAS
ncbi:MAG: oxygenase MpaB family protein [Solirubrobacteraceae bacterium]|nr:oxygenase MpaB family protein [Solirubrobacteraceae bacterium]